MKLINNYHKTNSEYYFKEGEVKKVCKSDLCFNCGEYVRIKKNRRKKNNHNWISMKDIVESGVLTSKIEVNTGELIFQNFFKNETLYSTEVFHNINNLSGKNILMKELSKLNVGYGQMGNMGIAIYSNDKNLIVIGEDLENINYILTEEGWSEEKKQGAKDFVKYISDNNLKEVGYISLSVWRWMCVDKSVLKQYDEEVDEEAVVCNITPGEYTIEHYFNLSDENNLMYSKIYTNYER